MAISEPHPRDEVERASRLYAYALAAQETRLAERAAAAHFLGLPLDAERTAIFRRVEYLVAQRPHDSAQLWFAAYDMVPPIISGPESSLRLLHECEDRLRSLEKDLTELSWPDNWDDRLCPVWKAYGGSGASATAWAEAGWKPDLVMTWTDVRGFEGVDLSVRLSATDVPPWNESDDWIRWM